MDTIPRYVGGHEPNTVDSPISPICISGAAQDNDANAVRLCASLLASGVEYAIATGQLTHRGSRRELDVDNARLPRCWRMMLIPVPGNHDCLGDYVSGAITSGPRVQTTCVRGWTSCASIRPPRTIGPG